MKIEPHNTRSKCEDQYSNTSSNQKVKINVKFTDINSNSDYKSQNSTMCNSEALNVTCSVKTSSKEAFSNSPSSGLALRNLGKSDDSDDEEEDDLARLLDEQGEQDDDEFELIENPCNGFNRSNVDNRCNGLPNVALNKQGQFALCSSEAVAKNETR